MRLRQIDPTRGVSDIGQLVTCPRQPDRQAPIRYVAELLGLDTDSERANR